MEIVELRPRAAPAAHLVHGRLIEPSPRVGELGPVDAQALLLAERLALADEARAPVHNRAEDIEGESFDILDSHGRLPHRAGALRLRSGREAGPRRIRSADRARPSGCGWRGSASCRTRSGASARAADSSAGAWDRWVLPTRSARSRRRRRASGEAP